MSSTATTRTTDDDGGGRGAAKGETMSDRTVELFDSETGDRLGWATADQIAASDEAAEKDGSGVILIDRDGNVVHAGSWDAQQQGVRRVYIV